MIKLNKNSLAMILGNRLIKDTSMELAQTITFAGSV